MVLDFDESCFKRFLAFGQFFTHLPILSSFKVSFSLSLSFSFSSPFSPSKDFLSLSPSTFYYSLSRSFYSFISNLLFFFFFPFHLSLFPAIYSNNLNPPFLSHFVFFHLPNFSCYLILSEIFVYVIYIRASPAHLSLFPRKLIFFRYAVCALQTLIIRFHDWRVSPETKSPPPTFPNRFKIPDSSKNRNYSEYFFRKSKWSFINKCPGSTNRLPIVF